MMKFLGAAVIAASLIAGPALAQGSGSGSMTAPATGHKAAVVLPPAKAKIAVHKTGKHVAHQRVAKKHVAKKYAAKKYFAKKHIVKQVKHLKTVKRGKQHSVKKIAG